MREPQAPKIIPSRVWWEAARTFWRGLAFKEKALIVMGVLVPALDQIARLASIGVTMKAISSGVRQHPDLETRLWLGFLILAASAISGLIVVVSNRVTRNLKGLVTRLVRRVYGRIMAATAGIPLNERESQIASLVAKERDFVKTATSGLLDFIDFVAAVSIVVVLLLALTWFNWIVGSILFVSGLVALLILKFRVRTATSRESPDAQNARKKMIEQFERIAGGGENTQLVIDRYADNDFDRITLSELEAKTRLQKKITAVMGSGSAILMAVVFFLVSAEGAFDERKMVWLVVFVFGLRMVVTHGKHAMVNWGAVLGEKVTLMELAKASIMPPPTPGEQDGEVDAVDAGRNGIAKAGPGPRIVDFSFHGLNGAEIVSREPMVLEMTVETGEEIRGFYWSFSILPPGGSPYIASKTSEDCGITWNLPPGRSRFRVVSGPLWLPAGKYSAMVGIAKGNRLLDLVGSQEAPLTITVLPDDIAKRSVQKRVASDAVLLDVEWDTEFRHEDSRVEPAGSESPSFCREIV
jgi:hypothetical protein